MAKFMSITGPWLENVGEPLSQSSSQHFKAVNPPNWGRPKIMGFELGIPQSDKRLVIHFVDSTNSQIHLVKIASLNAYKVTQLFY